MARRFPTGRLLLTAGVNDRVADDSIFAKFVTRSIVRHKLGDWGDVCPADRKENNLSLEQGLRLLSVYKQPTLPTIWIITEADRSATTVLYPEEY